MSRILAGLLLWLVGSIALATTLLPVGEMRTLSSSDPASLIAKVRAALDAGAYAHHPAAEREALWWMGHAAVNASDDAAVTEAVARLQALASVEHDSLAKSYAGFLSADLRIAQGDARGVDDAIRAAALQLDSPDPAHRALAEFQLCDAYDMAFQFSRSQPLCRKADAAFAALHDDWDQAQAKNDEGNNAFGLHQYAAAANFYHAARALYRKAGDEVLVLSVGDNLAQVYMNEGKPAEAIALSRASLANERAAGRLSDALISQYDIARAEEALGHPRAAMALIAKTVAATRKASLSSLLPDMLEEQSRMAEHNGDPALALSAERDALKVSRRHWADSLRSQESELAARYAAREKEVRIQELERNNQIKNLKLKAASAESARNALQIRRQRVTALAALVAVAGLGLGVVSLLLLMRQQRRYARELQHQATEDALTGVDNRRGFFLRASGLLATGRADAPPPHALLLFDFDYFKRVNDSGGHPFGDIVLNVTLEHLRAVVGKRGCLGRLGGEEFVVLCPHLGGQGALDLATEMRDAVSRLQFPNAPADVEVTISVGIALFDGKHCHDIDSWLRSADSAMYRAKAGGRDQVFVAEQVDRLLEHAAARVQPATD
ncbi:MAG TPA: GGDEF domain-containing protein [Rhodanobacteraceae bacterium]